MQPTMTPNSPERKVQRTAVKTDPVLKRGAKEDGGDGGGKTDHRSGLLIAGAVVLALAIGGAGWFLAQPGADTPHIGITTTLGDGAAFGGTVYYTADDQVSNKQWQDRADAF